MTQTEATPAPFRKEKTFSSYNQEQGQAYAQIRRGYHPNVYQALLSHHASTGGRFDVLLDVGCGPGTAISAIASQFSHAIGLDPSEGMVATARSFGGVTSTSEPIRYEISTAEELGKNLSPPIEDSSVDLIIAANAAHWFDMSGFWPSAARVLKPGGSVALWTGGPITVHPSVPNGAAIQNAIDEHRTRHLLPYYEPGNMIVRNRYADLLLPWTLEQPVSEFQEGTFLRRLFEPGEQFYTGDQEGDMDLFEKAMASGSAEVRWRQAHPDDVGTERDTLKILRKEIERLSYEAGVEEGKVKLKAAVRGVLLMVKKQA